jgi:hypothetical protein
LTIWQGISFGASPAWTHGLLYSDSSRRRLFCQLISSVGKYFSPSQLKVVLQRSNNLSFYRFSILHNTGTDEIVRFQVFPENRCFF